jgi:hypothetical protein
LGHTQYANINFLVHLAKQGNVWGCKSGFFPMGCGLYGILLTKYWSTCLGAAGEVLGMMLNHEHQLRSAARISG